MEIVEFLTTMRIRNWFGRWRPKKRHGNKGNYPNISSDPTPWTRFCLGIQKGESLWNQRSTELVRFQQTYGHCRVPRPEIYIGPSLPNGFLWTTKGTNGEIECCWGLFGWRGGHGISWMIVGWRMGRQVMVRRILWKMMHIQVEPESAGTDD